MAEKCKEGPPQRDERGEDKVDPSALEMVQKASLELVVVRATQQKSPEDHCRPVHWKQLILFDSTNKSYLMPGLAPLAWHTLGIYLLF